jgi:hypothetical protein
MFEWNSVEEAECVLGNQGRAAPIGGGDGIVGTGPITDLYITDLYMSSH